MTPGHRVENDDARPPRSPQDWPADTGAPFGPTAPAVEPQWVPYGHLYFARLASLAAGLVLTVISARALQPHGRGEFAALATAASLTVQIVNLGFSSSLVVLFSRRPRRVSRYRTALWGIPLVAGAMVSVFGLVWSRLNPDSPLSHLWPLLAFWIPIQLLNLHQAAALMASGGARVIAGIEIAGRATSVALGATALVLFPGSVPAFAAALLTGDGLIVALQAAALRQRSTGAARPGSARPFLWSSLRLGLRAYPLLFLPYLLIKADILLVRWLRGAAETGIYSVANQAVDVMLLLPSTIAAVALPSIVRAARPREEFVRVVRPTLLLSSALALAVALFGYWPILIVFGKPYAGAYNALLFFLPGFLCLALQSVLSQYFAARGFPLILSAFWLAGLVVNVVLTLALVPSWGYVAAAGSSSVGYATVVALMLWYYRHETGALARSVVNPPAVGS
jgi:O-antigen/teichoic acid export membrane protein